MVVGCVCRYSGVHFNYCLVFTLRYISNYRMGWYTDDGVTVFDGWVFWHSPGTVLGVVGGEMAYVQIFLQTALSCHSLQSTRQAWTVSNSFDEEKSHFDFVRVCVCERNQVLVMRITFRLKYSKY